MLGFIIICIIGIILYLIISSHFRRSKEADEKTLRPMSEWVILANSFTYQNREKMCYSLIVQASPILERLNIMHSKALRELMINQPNICKANFVLLIMNLATSIEEEKLDRQHHFLRDSFIEDQARAYFAECVKIIVHYEGFQALNILSIAACDKPMQWL